jgi:16S rRNA (guanine527-N7)-methyltransferase
MDAKERTTARNGSGVDSGLLKRGLQALRIPADPERLKVLALYLGELGRWNRAFGFVKAEGRDLIVRHLFDSLAGLDVLKGLGRNLRAIDVGSGAGFPGLPLAVFLPGWSFCLLERSGRRAAFLRNAVILCKLDNVRVLELDLREVKESFDVATFRAFAPLSRQLPDLLRILAPGGRVAAYKGRRERIEAELARLGGGVRVSVKNLSVPFLDEERHLVLISEKPSRI